MADKNIPNADFPEQVGINSREFQALLNDFEFNKIEVHSLMILRHGKVAWETHMAPYGRDVRQCVFSMGKVLVAIAIGFAIEENLLSLDSKVIDFFPEFRPPKRDKYLERMKVRHLLTMTSGKKAAPISLRNAEARLKSFFSSKWIGEPGKTPDYNAENICVLCDILRQVTDETITEYLTPRLYEPLEFDSAPIWEKDSTGIESGYWGLYLTPEELARISLCLMNKGVYKNKQVIPAEYAAEMTSIQVRDIPFNNKNTCTDFGFMVRAGNLRHSFMADASFSQYAVMASDYDVAFICTCSHLAVEKTRDCIFRHLHRMLIDCKDVGAEIDKLPSLKNVPIICSERNEEMEKAVKGKVLQFRSNVLLNALGVPYSMLPLTSIYLLTEKGNNINNIVLDFTKQGCTFSWDEGTDHNMIKCSMDGTMKYDEMTISGMDYKIICAAAWKDEKTLEIQVRPLESINEKRIYLEFNNKTVVMTSENVSATDAIIDTLGKIAEEHLESEGVTGPLSSLINNFPYILSSPIKGKIN